MRRQYIDRETGSVRIKTIFANRLINFLYSSARKKLPQVFRALTGHRISGWLGFLNYDLVLGEHLSGNRRFLRTPGVDQGECVDAAADLDTPHKSFEHRIRYWDTHPK